MGCAQKIVQNDGVDVLVGSRLEPYDYSGKTILTIKDLNEHIQKEIRQVQGLKGVSNFFE